MNLRKKCGIYAITHTASGTRYVGQSVSIGDRWYNHRSALLRGKHHAPHLQSAWTKYGPEAFEWTVLEIVERNVAALVEREQHWIDASVRSYNAARAGGSAFDYVRGEHTPETREKLRNAMTGRRHKPETIARLRAIAAASTYSHSPEIRQRISEAQKNVEFVMTDKRRAKYARQRGVSYPQAIEAMRAANAGVPCSEERKKKIGEANKGKRLGSKHKPETIEKMRISSSRPRPDVSAALRGRKRPQHVIDALKAANEVRWAGNVARIREAIAADPSASTTTISKRIKADWATVRKYQQEYRQCQP